MTWDRSHGVPFESLGNTRKKMDLLDKLAEVDSYWYSAKEFVKNVRYRKIESLTLPQSVWLSNIITSLGEESSK